MNLPKLSDKVVFFPEEYANIPICASQKKEMDRLYSIIKPKSQSSYSTLDLNPEALYKTIYNKISFKYTDKKSSRNRHRMTGTTLRQSPLHFNSSIYNNFRVNRKRANSTM